MAVDLKEVTGKIWNMCNELRGTMDPTEYKNYILGFLFYAFLSNKQEKYLDTILEPDDKLTINQRYAREAQGEDRDDYLEDISQNLGYVILPEDTWASLMERIGNDEFKPEDFQNLFDHFNANVEMNPDAASDLKGIFNDINLSDSRLGSNVNERAQALKGIVKLVDTVELQDEEGQDILGHIYQYLIEKFAASAGKKAGEFFTPVQPSKIMAKIVTDGLEDNDQAFTVFDPTCGSGSLLLQVGRNVPGADKPGKVQYTGAELNHTTYNMARMNLLMNDVSYEDMTLHNGDSLGPDWPDGPDHQGVDHPRFFDAVVMNPPYSSKWDNSEGKMKDPRFYEYKKLAPKSKADYAFLLHGLYHLKNTGKMAIVLPHGILFRGAAEGEIRKILLQKNLFDTIIGLPANLFYGTSIPTVIAVLNKNKKDRKVLFIDASKEFQKGKNQNYLSDENVEKILKTYRERKDVDKYARLVDLKEIEENDWNLNIPRYVDTSEEEEEIDIKQVLADLKKDDEEIARAEAWIYDQLKILGVMNAETEQEKK